MPDSLFASIERTPCYGKCPVYGAYVYKSGYATWNGRMNTEKVGEFTTRISKEDMAKIADKARSIDYVNLKSEYNSDVTDLPSVYTQLSLDGKKKAIKSRHNVPIGLREYEKFLDEILSAQKWTLVKALEKK